MEKNLSIKQLEDFVFSNKIIQNSLPKYKSLFDGWTIAQSSPSLRSLATRCLLDFVELVNEDDIKTIENILGFKINLPKFNHSNVKYFTTDIEKLENLIPNVSNYLETVLYRKGKEIRVLVWR
jgi:hypothetical protein